MASPNIYAGSNRIPADGYCTWVICAKVPSTNLGDVHKCVHGNIWVCNNTSLSYYGYRKLKQFWEWRKYGKADRLIDEQERNART